MSTATSFVNIVVTRNGHLVKAMLFHQSVSAFTPIVDAVKELNKLSAFPVCDNINEIAADTAKPVARLIAELNLELELSGYVVSSTFVEPADQPIVAPVLF